MRNKTITLCPTSYEWAQKQPNFSQWIRQKILETRDNKVKVNVRRCEECGFTHPRHMSRCSHYKTAAEQIKDIANGGDL